MTPLDNYNDKLQHGLIQEDQAQLTAMQYFQKIYANLNLENNNRTSIKALFRKKHLVKGLYLWGGVGIGKTFMMDCFYQALPFQNKMRMHFYKFMQKVHGSLKNHQGEKDPLRIIAKELASETIVLCFDELFVTDITDAMLLGRLFKYLFMHGVCLVATSNVSPTELYKNGLQRQQFLPAISLLQQHTEVLHIPTKIDYRLRHLKNAGVFYSPLNQEAINNMNESFATLTEGLEENSEPLLIYGRIIPVKKRAGDIVWFNFNEICSPPRSQKDYLAIAEKYHTVMISDVPNIRSHEKDTICLFISLVDILYDAGVRVVISAASPVPEIYAEGIMITEYTRTTSRLLEMQSEDYFAEESWATNN